MQLSNFTLHNSDMTRELLIIGTSGLAKEAAQLARRIDINYDRWTTISYITNDKSRLGEQLPFGKISKLDIELKNIDSPVDVVIGVGYPKDRERIVKHLTDNPNLCFPNLIHPDVEIDFELVIIGKGNMITKGVVLTCNITIGDFNLVNWNSTIGHDTEIGNFNVINPGSSLSGGVKLGDACLIGTGARILENLSINSNVVIGAGAVVTKAILNSGVYIGIPARIKSDS